MNKIKKIEFLISGVTDKLIPYLESNTERFPSSLKLIKLFNQRVNTGRRRDFDNIVQVGDIINEMCIAEHILRDNQYKCNMLLYEPPIQGTGETIDFCVEMEDGKTIYIDVKSLHPSTLDDWEKYCNAIENNRFSKNVNVSLFEDGLGGETWHKWKNSRMSMLTYAMQLEKKISCFIGSQSNITFAMVYCSNGWDWSIDMLEDFADFYRTGMYNSDDPYAVIEGEYIIDENIILSRRIDSFCYFQRRVTELKPYKFLCNITKR